MGFFISKQPNGLYCRFSTIVDTVTHWNLTKGNVIDIIKFDYDEHYANYWLNHFESELNPFDDVLYRFYPGNQSVDYFKKLLRDMGCSDDVINTIDLKWGNWTK